MIIFDLVTPCFLFVFISQQTDIGIKHPKKFMEQIYYVIS